MQSTTNIVAQQIAEKAYKEAFARWWSADYSMEGLKSKSVRSHESGESISLAAYWADFAHTTVTFAGRTWTEFHLPMHDLDGNPSPKAAWPSEKIDAFYNAIEAREAAGHAAYDRSVASAEEDRPHAYFDGVVFPRSGRSLCQWDTIPSFVDAIFAGDASFQTRILRNFAAFDGAVFTGTARFSGVTFARASFAGTIFLEQADFTTTTFAFARFDRTQFLGQSSSFRNGTSYGMHFFATTALSFMDFSGHDFRGGLEIGMNAAFHSSMHFRDGLFRERLGIVDATFDRGVDFSCRDGGSFDESVWINGAVFRDVVNFSGRTFQRSTAFKDTTFGGPPLFHGARPHSDTTFARCQFLRTVGAPASFAFMSWRGRAQRFAGLFWPPKKYPLSSQQILLATAAEKLQRWTFRFVPLAEWLPSMSEAQKTRNDETRGFENAYRALRHLFEGDSEMSGQFYRFEMDTRIRRTDVSIAERFVLVLFKMSSGYGRYVGRPFFVLAAAIGLTTLLLWMGVPAPVEPSKTTLPEALAVAWRLFLLPSPTPIDATNGIASWLATAPLIAFPLSALCGLVTAGVVGVFAVTLRRRFALK